MRTFGLTGILLVLTTTLASAQTPPTMPPTQPAPRVVPGEPSQTMSGVPANAASITLWYKQPVYDLVEARIGEVVDVLLDADGKVTAFIIGDGGFLGLGERHVAVPYNSVRTTTKDNIEWYLVADATKAALMRAPHLRYDRTAATWIPEATSRPHDKIDTDHIGGGPK